MLVLSIDESGRFEKQINEKKEDILFVGGILFQNLNDKNQEETRIKRFLIEITKEAQVELERRYPNQKFDIKYPNSFHMGSVDLGENIPKSIIREFREFIYLKLVKFLKRNEYKIICYIRDMHEDYTSGRQNSNIINDNKGGNLYERMVLQLIYNNIFYNLDTINEKEIVLNFATRKSAVSSDDFEAINEMNKLGGVRVKDPESGTVLYEFSNTLGYKSAIATKLRENPIKNCVNFDLNSYSINYKKENKNPDSLYLADIICGYLRSKFDQSKQTYGIKSLMETIKKETGSYPIITIEDKEEINSTYNKLIQAINNKDFIEALLYKYEIEYSNSKFSDYYSEYLVNPLEERIKSLFNRGDFSNYLYKLEILLSKSVDDESAKYNKAKYIIDYLWDIIESNEEVYNKIRKNYIYQLADCTIRALNHQGCLAKDIEKYREKCESDEFKEYITIDEYINTQNRLATTYANSLMYEEALKVLEEPLELIEEVKEYKSDIASLVGCKVRVDIIGKLYSSRGQFNAFLNRNIEAKECFEKALEEFGGSNPVTEGYNLHNYICLGEKDLFRENLESLAEGVNWVRKVEKCNDRYMLYIIIKGIYKLFMNELKIKDAKKIKEAIDKKNKRNEHPWELIYRNLGLIFYELGEIELFKDYIDESINCIDKPVGTLLLIKYLNKFTKVLNLKEEYDEKEKYDNKIKNLKKEFVTKCLDENEDFKNVFKDIENIEDSNLESYLLSKFTYMYN